MARNVYKKGDKWVNKKQGNKRVSSTHDTQKDAIDTARGMLKKDGGGELSIHGRDGKIRQKDTVPHGNDPHPPTDKA